MPPRRLPAVEERSAGGVVVDVHEGEARIAVIARRNRAGRVEWCLPKGHIEGEETLPETAAREVAEETGIIGNVLIELGTIDYWFAAGERRIHKYVHHFLLEAVGGDLTIENDPDHEAIDVAWLPLARGAPPPDLPERAAHRPGRLAAARRRRLSPPRPGRPRSR